MVNHYYFVLIVLVCCQRKEVGDTTEGENKVDMTKEELSRVHSES